MGNPNQAKRTESTENWGYNPNWNNWFNSNSLPNFDKLRKEASKNMEAISAANQVALESLQAMSRRTAEVIQQNAREVLEHFREGCSSKDLSEVQAKNIEYVNGLVQNYCNNTRELAEIASKSALEVVEICNERVAEATRELCNNRK